MHILENHPQKPENMHPAVYAPVHELWKALAPGIYYDVASPDNLKDILSLINCRIIRTTVEVKDPTDKRRRTDMPVLVACLEYDPTFEAVLIDLEEEQREEPEPETEP